VKKFLAGFLMDHCWLYDDRCGPLVKLGSIN